MSNTRPTTSQEQFDLWRLTGLHLARSYEDLRHRQDRERADRERCRQCQENAHAPLWTDAETATLARLWAKGISLKSIAAALGRSLSSVRMKRVTRKLSPRPRGWKGSRP